MGINKKTRIRAIDLFCGAGGSSWGASQERIEIVAGFDRWNLAGVVYQDNFPHAVFHGEDISDLVPIDLKGELGAIDLILASPECTNHSCAKGAVARCDKSRETAFHVTRFAATFRPRWVIVENVISMTQWGRYEEFIQSLSDLGYHCREIKLDASDFGVPQSRRRLFILCDLESEPPSIRPEAHIKSGARSVIDFNGAYRFNPLRTDGRAPATLERAERAISALGADAEFLIVYYGSDGSGGWQSLDRPLRTITTLDRFAYVKPTPDGHVMRMLQPSELKLAMGWSNSFRIDHGTRRDRIKMIGNAVCPTVMQSVVRHLISASSNPARTSVNDELQKKRLRENATARPTDQPHW